MEHKYDPTFKLVPNFFLLCCAVCLVTLGLTSAIRKGATGRAFMTKRHAWFNLIVIPLRCALYAEVMVNVPVPTGMNYILAGQVFGIYMGIYYGLVYGLSWIITVTLIKKK
jgi:hypothetical protein